MMHGRLLFSDAHLRSRASVPGQRRRLTQTATRTPGADSSIFPRDVRDFLKRGMALGVSLQQSNGGHVDSLQDDIEAAVEAGIEIEVLHRKIHELEIALQNARGTIAKLRAQLGRTQNLLDRIR